MKKYIALLRGINVGGQKSVPMTSLKELFIRLGFKEVTTYIQSGNVVFTSGEEKTSTLKAMIEAGIQKKFRFEVEVFILKQMEILRILKECPFRGDALKEGERIHFTLLTNVPPKENIEKLASYISKVDEYKISKKVIFLLCRKGYGKSLYNNNFVERVLRVRATTRNLETMRTLGEL